MNKWAVYNYQGRKIEVDDLGYLNYLIEESRVIIHTLNKRKIRSLIFDFEELKEYPFFRNYLLTIDSHIGSLKRVLNYELIKNRPRRAINCSLLQ